MAKKESSEYLKFQEYLNRLRSTYFHALNAFWIYDELSILKAPNIIGKEKSRVNVEVMSKYNAFFSMVPYSLNRLFMMELAKILDSSRESLHLDKLIEYAQNNKEKFSVDEFIKANPERPLLKELTERYEGIKDEDIEEIKHDLEATADIRKKIKGYRDQNLAHDDINKKDFPISIDEVKKIFDLIAKILNTFSNKTDFSTTSYTFAKEECIRDTDSLVDHLIDYEKTRKIRLKRIIMKECGVSTIET